jgi:hypothetical protein
MFYLFLFFKVLTLSSNSNYFPHNTLCTLSFPFKDWLSFFFSLFTLSSNALHTVMTTITNFYFYYICTISFLNSSTLSSNSNYFPHNTLCTLSFPFKGWLSFFFSLLTLSSNALMMFPSLSSEVNLKIGVLSSDPPHSPTS